jgi:toxin ParE1/3/4
MYEVELTEAANRDLADIAAYTRSEWGERKAVAYLGELMAALASLRDFPAAHPATDHLMPGTRRLLHASHACYFRILPAKIRVLAIIHVRQEPDLTSGQP